MSCKDMSCPLRQCSCCLCCFKEAINPCCAVQVDTDFTNDDDVRVILIVHDTKPPFLDGRTVFTKQARPVPYICGKGFWF